MKTKLFFLIIGCFTLPLLIYFLIPSHQPLHLIPKFQPPKPSITTHSYFILGFLPYWNLDKLTPPALETLDNLAYFSLELKADGSVHKLKTPTEEIPNWTGFKKFKQLQLSLPVTLVFTLPNQNSLNSLLTNPQARRQAITQIVHYATTTPNLQGINLDFEPTSSISPSLRQNFTQFVIDLNQQLHSLHPTPKLSIDIYPTATNPTRLWDLKALSPYTDYFIIMAYDYHHRSNPAGPNAPLVGSGSNYNEDILKNLAEITQLVQPSKLLLGIPFYGWEWTTHNSDKYSSATTKSLASLSRINTLIDQKHLETHWDRNSLTPFIIYQDEHQTKQIYFDNLYSIKLKLQLVKDAHLAGIAIWAIGYEGLNPELWHTISSQLH